MALPHHRSSATPLAALYAALIVYASLYPFSDWRAIDAGLFSFLVLPWPRWWTAFDLVANLLGYLPLGALLFGALVRSGWPVRRSVVVAWSASTALSLAMEFTQNFLPRRVASNVDLMFNALGAAAGIAAALAIHALGGVERWQSVRERWFIGRSAGGLVLLVLWPFGLLFPTPVVLGVGRGLPLLQEPVAELLEGTALSGWVADQLGTVRDFVPMSPVAEVATIAVGLLGPSLVAFTIMRPGWRRLVMAVVLATLGCAATTLSTALNFGPQHAFAWRTVAAWLGVGLGMLLAAVASRAEARICVALGLVALTALIVGVAQAPEDPYFALSLHAWERGDFIRFHGAAQLVGWLWPFVALAYLLSRVRATA
jgi:VanZ family protein